MIVPMVAYRPDCYRIGYGGGYYDSTIKAIREIECKDIHTIGVAFEAQKADFPIEGHDMQLDYIVTENTVLDSMRTKYPLDKDFLGSYGIEVIENAEPFNIYTPF
mmetsp:Transcript_23421/g.20362  ORF Transcript_23421/g.20362 Transcript_23421/m.20362 type:complete len:105 (-) Transcript_23421:497-811(-)